MLKMRIWDRLRHVLAFAKSLKFSLAACLASDLLVKRVKCTFYVSSALENVYTEKMGDHYVRLITPEVTGCRYQDFFFLLLKCSIYLTYSV